MCHWQGMSQSLSQEKKNMLHQLVCIIQLTKNKKINLAKIFQVYAKCMLLTVEIFQTEMILNLQMPKYKMYFKWQKVHFQS